MAKVTYHHDEKLHHMESPGAMVPVLMELFKPNSVVDFGCGIGTFLRVFNEQGIEDVLGLDGSWVNREKLRKNISESSFRECDLGAPVNLNKKYDLAISFEVGEHIHPDCAETFVNNIVQSSDTVVFGAAIPFQGGQNHLNEQWPSYWAELFAKHGYQQHDLIRPAIWGDKRIQVWYRQNVFVYTRNGQAFATDKSGNFSPNFEAIHPDMYSYKAARLEKILSGKASFTEYFRWIGKKLLRSVGLLKS
ncbi:MAG: methyltransferase domain-containing protein [Cryomorphaceae bacterium]|nr:MAG: methyltransferase domain-containing protein [Cryomorphaceae bacterium]